MRRVWEGRTEPPRSRSLTLNRLIFRSPLFSFASTNWEPGTGYEGRGSYVDIHSCIFLLLGNVLYFHFICRPMLVHGMTLVSFGLFRKIWATCENFLGKWFTAPLAKNCPYAYDLDTCTTSYFTLILGLSFKDLKRFSEEDFVKRLKKF